MPSMATVVVSGPINQQLMSHVCKYELPCWHCTIDLTSLLGICLSGGGVVMTDVDGDGNLDLVTGGATSMQV